MVQQRPKCEKCGKGVERGEVLSPVRWEQVIGPYLHFECADIATVRQNPNQFDLHGLVGYLLYALAHSGKERMRLEKEIQALHRAMRELPEELVPKYWAEVAENP